MSSLIDSEAHFDARCLSIGMSANTLTDFQAYGITTLANLAFAVGQPGQPLDPAEVDQLLLQVCSRAATVQDTNVTRRLVFEAHTLVIASLRQTVEQKDDSVPRKVPQAERAARMEQLRLALSGITITGDFEPGHAVLDKACNMLEQNVIKYIEPAVCITRASEVLGATKDKKLSFEHGALVMNDKETDLRAPTSTEMQLYHAFARRGIAFQFADIMSYDAHFKWTSFLFEAARREAPPGFSSPGINAIIQCDRAAWVRLAELCPDLRRTAAGAHPLEHHLQELRSDQTIMLHLSPLAKSDAVKRTQDEDQHGDKWVRLNPKGKGKGKKGKGKGKGAPSMPAELRGKWHSMPNGDPICFGYNTSRGCNEKNVKAGERCSKGWHCCAEPRCQEPHPLSKHR